MKLHRQRRSYGVVRTLMVEFRFSAVVLSKERTELEENVNAATSLYVDVLPPAGLMWSLAKF